MSQYHLSSQSSPSSSTTDNALLKQSGDTSPSQRARFPQKKMSQLKDADPRFRIPSHFLAIPEIYGFEMRWIKRDDVELRNEDV